MSRTRALLEVRLLTTEEAYSNYATSLLVNCALLRIDVRCSFRSDSSLYKPTQPLSWKMFASEEL